MKGFILFLVLLLVVLHGIGLQKYSRPELATDLSTQATEILQTHDEFKNVKVAGDHFDLKLEGEVPAPEAREKAVNLLREQLIAGRTRVKSGLEVAKKTTPPAVAVSVPSDPMKVTIQIKGNSAAANGSFGSKAQKSVLSQLPENLQVSDRTQVAENVSTPSWWNQFPRVLQLFAKEAEDATLRIDGERLSLAGNMRTPGGKADFETKLAAINGVRPSLSLSWPELVEPLIAAKREGKRILLSGRVPTQTDKRDIERKIKNGGVVRTGGG